jgi:hypothetical protein
VLGAADIAEANAEARLARDTDLEEGDEEAKAPVLVEARYETPGTFCTEEKNGNPRRADKPPGAQGRAVLDVSAYAVQL